MALGRNSGFGRRQQQWAVTANSRVNTMDDAAVDEGLRAYMLRVYSYMAGGLALAGAVCLFLASQPQLVIGMINSGFYLIFFIAWIIFSFIAPRMMMTKSVATAQIVFWIDAALWGVAIAPTITAFLLDPTMVSTIARAFFITAAMFAGLSLYGYTTKRNLGPIAAFAMMAIIGVLLVMIVNMIFFQDTGLHLLISFAVVGLFSIMTAFQTQQIKEMYYATTSDDDVTRFAVFGASQLIGSFIILFLYILQILAALRGE